MPDSHGLSPFTQLSPLAKHCWQQLQSLMSEAELRSAGRWVVGFSGGADSAALLLCLREIQQLLSQQSPRSIVAVHIHHGLSEFADQWQEHCRSLCENKGIEFIALPVTVSDGAGLEAAARDARYQAFESVLGEGDFLFLGHHQQDQAETLLLRLMRGSGVRGLGAMAPRRQLSEKPGSAILLRPLLEASRADLERYLQLNEVSWVNDDSNADLKIERNYLRQEVMPLLEARWPGFSSRWAQSATWCREADQQLQSRAEQQLIACAYREEKLGSSLELKNLAALPEQEWAPILRQWAMKDGYSLPSAAQLEQIKQQLILAQRPDSSAQVLVAAACFSRFDGRLNLWPKAAEQTPPAQIWHSQRPLQLAGGWCLRAEEIPTSDPGGLWLPAQVELRARSASLRCRPKGRRHSQSLKKLLQEYRVPPWLRNIAPLVYKDEALLAFGDYWQEGPSHQLFEQLPGSRYCRLHWFQSPLGE